ncbi:MAG: putative O-glycosylation ligase, exosortase A system-associated [Rhodospirillales bacterium]|nr:putative O-glycosylation ligase, exosortase A system-associated [Rhodospirillales bacterium]
MRHGCRGATSPELDVVGAAMRGIVINFFLLVLLPLSLTYPYFGVLAYNWFTYLNPHRLAYGMGAAIPWAKLIVAALVFSALASREKTRIQVNGITALLAMLLGWTTISTLFAVHPDRAWGDLGDFAKVIIAALIASAMITDRKRLHAFVWIMVIATAYWTVKGGIYTSLLHGKGHVIGPPHSFFPESNRFARVAIMAVPLMLYLAFHSRQRYVRMAMAASAFFTVLSLIGTGSRGGFVGFAAMMAWGWLFSRRKAVLLVAAVSLGAVGYLLMPNERLDSYKARLETIETGDSSINNRFKAWNYALEVARHSPLVGNGFGAFMDNYVITSKSGYLEAHSNYFQYIGEHGWPGLIIYLMLGVAVLLRASSVVRRTRGHPQLYWARDLALCIQLSMIGYFVGGLVENTAYFEFFYTLIGMLLATDSIVTRQISELSPARDFRRRRRASLPAAAT